MASNPYSKFFWQDWHGDDLLALCSMGAQGVWMRLLVIASRSDTPGHVLLDGKKPTMGELLDACRCRRDITEVMLEGWISELTERGVCSVTSQGVIFCRRMVRDFRKWQAKSSGGKKSAEVRRGVISGIRVCSNKSAEVPSTISHQPSTSSHKNPPQESSSANGLAAAAGRIERISKITGIDPGIRGPSWIRSIVEMEAEGIDFELDLLPAIRERAERGRIPGDLRGLSWFREPARERSQARALKAATPAKTPDFSRLAASDWQTAERWFLRAGWWDRAVFGPTPLEEGCRHPNLAPLEAAWTKQGATPEQNLPNMYPHGRAPRPFWGSNIVALKKAGEA